MRIRPCMHAHSICNESFPVGKYISIESERKHSQFPVDKQGKM